MLNDRYIKKFDRTVKHCLFDITILAELRRTKWNHFYYVKLSNLVSINRCQTLIDAKYLHQVVTGLLKRIVWHLHISEVTTNQLKLLLCSVFKSGVWSLNKRVSNEHIISEVMMNRLKLLLLCAAFKFGVWKLNKRVSDHSMSNINKCKILASKVLTV